jgi:flavin reductase (DIM6/NTAB) family NADH-FMN oxidoreductase RutF
VITVTPLRPDEMRTALAAFATGVAVVSCAVAGGWRGTTVNSLTSVSLDPPLLLVCLQRDGRAVDAVRRAGRFGVSILSAHQQAVAEAFARAGGEDRPGVRLDHGPGDVPLIGDAIAQLVCAVQQEVLAGDHVVLFGRIESVARHPGRPLCFYGRGYGGFDGDPG